MDRINAGSKAAVLAGKILIVHLLYGDGIGVVDGKNQHIGVGEGSLYLYLPPVRGKGLTGITGIFQKIAEDHHQIFFRYGYVGGDGNLGRKGNLMFRGNLCIIVDQSVEGRMLAVEDAVFR